MKERNHGAPSPGLELKKERIKKTTDPTFRLEAFHILQGKENRGRGEFSNREKGARPGTHRPILSRTQQRYYENIDRIMGGRRTEG